MSAAELAGGFGRPASGDPSRRGSSARLEQLPADTRRLLQLAAADPVGEPLLLWRAAGRLGIEPAAAAAAVDAGLFEIGAQVRFRHPSARSAVYRSASPGERHVLHGALADATDAAARSRPARLAPRAGHARARRAGRRGAGALGRSRAAPAAASRRPPPSSSTRRRSRRSRLGARAACWRPRARSTTRALLNEALELLVAIEAGPIDARQAAEIEELRGEIALDQRRVSDAARLLVDAARRFDSLDAGMARSTHLKAIGAAIWADPEALFHAAEAAAPGAARRGSADDGGPPAGRLRVAGDGWLRRGGTGAATRARRRARARGRRRCRQLALAYRVPRGRHRRHGAVGRRGMARAGNAATSA